MADALQRVREGNAPARPWERLRRRSACDTAKGTDSTLCCDLDLPQDAVKRPHRDLDSDIPGLIVTANENAHLAMIEKTKKRQPPPRDRGARHPLARV